MKRQLLLGILLSVILLSSTAALADGDFYGGGPYGTKITSLPYTISAPGAYYLGGNLSSTGSGITISHTPAPVNDVTLDLMGFSITGPGSGTGISMSGSTNVEIRNGTVSGWDYGIFESGSGLNHRIFNVRAAGATSAIRLYGGGHLVKGCDASQSSAGFTAIYLNGLGTVSGCKATPASNANGIVTFGGTISDNVVIGNGGTDGYGIYAGSAPAVIRRNEVSNFQYCIYCGGAASIIGNAVTINSNQTGVSLINAATTMVDQNCVTVASGATGFTTYTAHNLVTAWRMNF